MRSKMRDLQLVADTAEGFKVLDDAMRVQLPLALARRKRCARDLLGALL